MFRTVRPGSNTFGLFGTNSKDGQLDKLVKYVPVEALAPAIGIAAAGKDNELLVKATFVVAVLLGGLIIAARSRAEHPRLWFWPFMLCAFIAWSLGASEEFRSLLGTNAQTGQWVLAIVAFALPP